MEPEAGYGFDRRRSNDPKACADEAFCTSGNRLVQLASALFRCLRLPMPSTA